ncbi:hypothetical protein PV11_09487 [Exophiala sideris]|uniref:Uncharacterized protein n=1 Tax=Exophiala sideris TaxID=1016849 RepID=A0A0D1YA61_9EURO|nr:hypothetical protein PV11_09487 [Exophiala sideris]
MMYEVRFQREPYALYRAMLPDLPQRKSKGRDKSDTRRKLKHAAEEDAFGDTSDPNYLRPRSYGFASVLGQAPRAQTMWQIKMGGQEKNAIIKTCECTIVDRPAEEHRTPVAE